MTEKELFQLIRNKQADGKLTQLEVDATNKLLACMPADELYKYLVEINDWQADGRMTVSQKCIDMIKEFENFESKPYKDVKGVWTIGYGATYYPNGKKVTGLDAPVTESLANEMLLKMVDADYSTPVNILLANEIKAGKVNQNMFDAIVCLAYNIGMGQLASSSVIRFLKAGDKQQAADSFRLFKYSGGKVYNGLVRRRERERELFLA